MKILVLGGTGFLGSALVRGLASLGHDISVVSRGIPDKPFDPKIKYVSDTLDSLSIQRKILPDLDFVFHLASDTTPGSSMGQPCIESLNNIMPTLRFLEQMHTSGSAHFVYISTGGAIYTDYSDPPFTELAGIGPISYYGAGKVAVESFLHAYSKQTGNKVTVLRPSNVYGPGQVLKTNFGIVPTLFQKVDSKQPFEIWGDGTNVRDYLYIEDLVSLCIALLHKPTDGFEVFNVGSAKGVSILDLISLIEDIAGGVITTQFQPARSVDIAKVVLDVTKAKIQLGWTPRVDLRRGLEKTWQWLNP